MFFSRLWAHRIFELENNMLATIRRQEAYKSFDKHYLLKWKTAHTNQIKKNNRKTKQQNSSGHLKLETHTYLINTFLPMVRRIKSILSTLKLVGYKVNNKYPNNTCIGKKRCNNKKTKKNNNNNDSREVEKGANVCGMVWRR